MTVATGLAERDEVATGELLVWVKMKREDVVHLELDF